MSKQAGVVINEEEVKRLENADKKVLRKKIMSLAGPSLTEMILINLMQMLNMIMVSRVGPEAVTAVGLTNQPIFFAYAVFIALNIGTTAIVARSIGSGDPETANRAAQQSFILNISISIVVMTLGFLFAKPILQFMRAEEEVFAAGGVLYAKIQFLSLGFSALSMGLSAMLRGAGDTITPMRVNILTNCVLVGLGFPLIYGFLGLPKLGVVGAAVATIIASALGATLFVRKLFSGNAIIKLSFRNIWMLDRSLVKRMLKIGLPSAGEQFVMRGGQMVYAIVVAGLGTAVYAANQIAFSILGLTFMPGLAFAAAATTLVGQSLGAQRPDLAEKFGWEIRKLGAILSGAIGILFILFAPYIMMPYIDDPDIIAYGAIALRVVGVVQVSQSTAFILAGALRGAGDTKYPLYATFVGIWGFRVILCLLLVNVFELGILGAWIAIAADQLMRSFLIVGRYRSGKWKGITV